MLFPTICVDNFFEDPKAIRELAFSLERDSAPDGRWPGKRTKLLHEIAPGYHDFFSAKLMKTFYDFRKHEVTWQIETYFQFIESYGTTAGINEGWIHKDDNCILAGIVYLNEKPELSAGTSLFARNSIDVGIVNTDTKQEFYKNPNSVDTQTYVEKLKQNNAQFTETVTINNVYNRMACYDGAQYHKANNFICGEEPRLTQVFFVKNLYADWFPIPSMRSA